MANGLRATSSRFVTQVAAMWQEWCTHGQYCKDPLWVSAATCTNLETVEKVHDSEMDKTCTNKLSAVDLNAQEALPWYLLAVVLASS
eukprot:4245141-Amphidinium_carterae.3